MKHYKSVEFLSIFRMLSPPHKRKAPPIDNFLATVLCLLLIFCPQEAQSYPIETRV